MSVKREYLDAGRIDLVNVTTGKRLPLIPPGEILRDDFLVPMKISVYTLAQEIKVPRSRVNDIVLGRRGITADTAISSGALFRHHAGFLDQPASALRFGRGGTKASPPH
jgi:addiction module HigA family antidote